MSDYSTSPQDLLAANRQKGYVGLHIQQGVPLLDRDLNLLQDLITATVRSVISRYIGNGAAAGADGFAIQPLAAPQNVQSFNISAGTAPPGTALVGGIEVSIPADVTYQAQSSVALTTPTAAQPNPRPDLVYLDVSLIEVDGTTDTDLNNTQDIGIETSARLKPVWVVQVAENVPIPAAPPGHVYYPLAQLMRPLNVATIDATMITDLRQQRLTVSAMERRLRLAERLVIFPAFAPLGAQFFPKAGGPGQTVNLNGHNFNLGTVTVIINGVVAPLSANPTATALIITVPPGLAAGGTNITVSTDGGSVTSDDSFTVQTPPPPPPAPVFAAPGGQFSPKQGSANQAVMLSGTNFDQPGLTVTIGGTACPLTGTPTANQIPINLPVGPAGKLPFTVVTAGGSATSTDLFMIQ